MTKKIAYTITDSGMDGRSKTRVVAAFWTEEARDAALEKDKNRIYRSTGEQIVDVAVQEKSAIAKLDGIDRLVLDIG